MSALKNNSNPQLLSNDLREEFSLFCDDQNYYGAIIAKSTSTNKSPSVLKELLREEVMKDINTKWNVAEFDWFVAFLNKEIDLSSKLEDKLKLLTKISELLSNWDLKLDLDNLKDLLEICPKFDVFLASFFSSNSPVSEESIFEISDDEFINNILFSYIVLKDRLLSEEEPRQNAISEDIYFKELNQISSLSSTENMFYFELLEKYEQEKNWPKYHETRHKIAEGNLRLVLRAVQKLKPSQTDMLDLIQEGNEGLLKAIDNFDYKKGYKFSTYAFWYIKRFLKYYSNHTNHLIQVDTHVKDQMLSVRKTKQKLLQENGHVSLEELAISTGKSVEKLSDYELYEIYQSNTTSLNDSYLGKSGEDRNLADIIADESAQDPVLEAEKKDLFRILNQGLGNLKTEYEFILRMRFGLPKENGDNTHFNRPHTLNEIAEYFNVKIENIRQKEKKALKKLRNSQSLSESYYGINILSPHEGLSLQEILECKDEEFNYIKAQISESKTLADIMYSAHGLNLDQKYHNFDDYKQYEVCLNKLKDKLDKVRKEKTKNLQKLLGCNDEDYEKIVLKLWQDRPKYDFLLSIFNGHFSNKINVLLIPNSQKQTFNFIIADLKNYLNTLSKEDEDQKYDNHTFQEILACSNEFIEYFLNILEEGSPTEQTIKTVHGPNLDQPFKRKKIDYYESIRYYNIMFRCRNMIPLFEMEQGKTLQEILECDDEIFADVKTFIYSREKSRNFLTQIFGQNLDQPKNYQLLNSSNNKYYNVIMGIIRKNIKAALEIKAQEETTISK